MTNRTPNDEHEYIEMLIPWYIKGALNEEETNKVSQHLEHCPICQKTLNRELKLSRAFQQPPDDLDTYLSQQEQHFQQLEKIIDDTSHSNNYLNVSAYRKKSKWMTMAFSTACVLLCVVSILFFNHVYHTKNHNELSYQLLTHEKRANDNTPLFQIIFHPDTQEKIIRQFFIEFDTVLLSAPSTKGVYRFTIHNQQNNPHDVLETIRNKPYILWAEIEI